MSILDGKLAIKKGYKVVNGVENNVFANSLIDTTIQDDGKKKRDNDTADHKCNVIYYK